MIISNKKVSFNEETFEPNISATVMITASELTLLDIYNDNVTEDMYYSIGKELIDAFKPKID